MPACAATTPALVVVQYAPLTATASLTVAVRARPLIRAEIAKGGRRDIIRVLDNKVVLVLDPDDNKVGTTYCVLHTPTIAMAQLARPVWPGNGRGRDLGRSTAGARPWQMK